MFNRGPFTGGGGSGGGSTSIGSTIGGSPVSGAALYTDGSGLLAQSSDADTTFILGRAKIGSPTTDVAFFSHFDNLSTTNYALKQDANGGTQLNSASGQNVSFSTAGTLRFIMDAATFYPNVSNSYDFGAASKRVRRLYMGEYIEGIEQTAPSVAPANGYRIFAQDNGAGKTQLMVIFQSGAAQQIAIEP